MEFDTLVVDADKDLVHLTFRCHRALRNGPHDVTDLAIDVAGANQRAA